MPFVRPVLWESCCMSNEPHERTWRIHAPAVPLLPPSLCSDAMLYCQYGVLVSLQLLVCLLSGVTKGLCFRAGPRHVPVLRQFPHHKIAFQFCVLDVGWLCLEGSNDANDTVCKDCDECQCPKDGASCTTETNKQRVQHMNMSKCVCVCVCVWMCVCV